MLVARTIMRSSSVGKKTFGGMLPFTHIRKLVFTCLIMSAKMLFTLVCRKSAFTCLVVGL